MSPNYTNADCKKRKQVNDCELCRIIDEKSYIWIEKGFAGVMCKSCGKPMVILTDHRANICPVEKDLAKMIALKYYRFLVPIGDGSISGEHWNEHYI